MYPSIKHTLLWKDSRYSPYFFISGLITNFTTSAKYHSPVIEKVFQPLDHPWGVFRSSFQHPSLHKYVSFDFDVLCKLTQFSKWYMLWLGIWLAFFNCFLARFILLQCSYYFRLLLCIITYTDQPNSIKLNTNYLDHMIYIDIAQGF